MTGEGGGIGQHSVVAHHGIMADVGIGHDENMAADAGNSSAFYRTAIQRDILANHVVVADLDRSFLAGKGEVLRIGANGAERIETVI